MVVYTVTQVADHLRLSLEGDPQLADLWVLGEVSNVRVSPTGHSYFTLKDRQSRLGCVMFKGQRGSDLLVEGVAVSAHGRITFYPPRGSTDFVVDLAVPQGLGELALELERLKMRLQAEGLFEPSRKRPLPPFPQVVGVVTSPTGAVFHDIQKVIQRRYPLVEILLSPTLVQGAEAAPQIVAAIERLNLDAHADVIILARGGGSLEELWPFNEEIVARAIYASRVPVVSAIGHETDVTLADLVADVRAPTPSAAAEIVVPDGMSLRQELVELAERCRRTLVYLLDHQHDQVSEMKRRLRAGLPDLQNWLRRVDDLGRSVHVSLANRLTTAKLQVDGAAHRLGALEPAGTLRRGYAVVQRGRVVVRSTTQVTHGDPLTITVTDGVIPATTGSRAKSRHARQQGKASRPPPVMKRLL